ncbi:MAG: AraC family transcriptional regulator [Lachnospiraceae bacterium]|nr:AraC family transcriptional regulator [Lachnospiraceae bacterium]
MPDLEFSIFPNERFVDLNLYQFGREKCKPGHSFGPARRNHYLFHFVLSGTGALVAKDKQGENRTYQIRTEQGFMIFPKQETTYTADFDHPWEYMWIEFDGLRVREALTSVELSEDSPVYHAQYKDLRLDMQNEMKFIVQHPDSPPLCIIGHLYLFLDLFIRSIQLPVQPTGNSVHDFYISEAFAYIEQNFQNQITVEDIANVLGIDRSYFGRIFHKATGQTPQNFLMNYRMSKAAELLKVTKLSIADIGNSVGYPDPQHFSRAFRRIYDISPRKWKTLNQIQKME